METHTNVQSTQAAKLEIDYLLAEAVQHRKNGDRDSAAALDEQAIKLAEEHEIV
jgi:hypothetical protein